MVKDFYSGSWSRFINPMEIFCNNKGEVALRKEPKDHGRPRHVERKYNYIRHKVEEGALVVNCVSSKENPADPLTKGLRKIKHFEHAKSIGLRDDIRF